MRTEQCHFVGGAWTPASPGGLGADASLVFVFGGRGALSDEARLQEIASSYPGAVVVGCSTAGEIRDVEVHDDSIVVTAVALAHTRVVAVSAPIDDPTQSRDVARGLGDQLVRDGLAHVFVLSDGLNVNGSELVAGLTEVLPASVTLTGGLSGDGADFTQTLVLSDGVAAPKKVVAVGFYGDRLKVGYGSLGGWDAFGPKRVVTRSTGNVLFELDGESALGLYKKYLGEHAEGLPATGLLFPLAVQQPGQGRAVVRTILAVDDATGSMTFAGDVAEGATAQLMKANFDRLVDGAMEAARTSVVPLSDASTELAILISCVGRKLVLKQRVEEEVEAVRDVVGDGAAVTGFYSYGEISPFTPGATCELHNQTMTITTFSET